jgi:hypothetical protein
MKQLNKAQKRISGSMFDFWESQFYLFPRHRKMAKSQAKKERIRSSRRVSKIMAETRDRGLG